MLISGTLLQSQQSGITTTMSQRIGAWAGQQGVPGKLPLMVAWRPGR